MNITKYRHFDSLTYLHVLGITSSGGHTLIPGNFRYIAANFRSETGSDAAHAVWPVLNVNWVAAPSMWTGVASDPRSESVRREYSNAAWVSAPSMWAECRPPPCGLSARPLHVGSVCGLCHVKIVLGAKIVPAYVIVCLHPDNLPGNRRRDAENMFPNDEIT